MNCDKGGPSRTDSPPLVTLDMAASSLKGISPPSPTSQDDIARVSADTLLSEDDDPSDEQPGDTLNPEDLSPLALLLGLTERPCWATTETLLKIVETCGEAGNHKCRQCGRRFSTTRQLRVHALQHYTNVFCPCGEYSFQRDYVLCHQRISRCHTGQAFAVDAESFPEFRNFILPYVGTPINGPGSPWGFRRLNPRWTALTRRPELQISQSPHNPCGSCWLG